MGKLLLLLLFIFCTNLASATILYGNIYTWDLQPISNIYVTIDSTPQQNMVSTDGTYSFELNSGTYTLIAEQRQSGETLARSTEEITVNEEGTFRVDIILFPEIEEEPEDIDPGELDLNGKKANYYLIALAVIFIVSFLVWLNKRFSKKHPDETDETDEVLEIIKKQGGRTTQKEIRKVLGLSEAKVSLIITELEHKNKVEKIKKGRGNIIILKK